MSDTAEYSDCGGGKPPFHDVAYTSDDKFTSTTFLIRRLHIFNESNDLVMQSHILSFS